MEFTFICMGKKAVSVKSTKHFLNMGHMLSKVVRVDQDVVQIDYDLKVYHICEDVIHKLLKSCGGISKPFRHYQPLKGPVSGSEQSSIHPQQ